MGIYDKFGDTPNAIKKEGQEITLRYQRTSDTTARISWNIPSPVAGCGVNQLAYDGIVVTVSSQPANYLSTSPKDGVYYNGDLTVDADMHAGDKLDAALVLAAFYNDKTTTFIDVTDLSTRTAYFFSAYAVDKVARYHTQGVHAYSIPVGPDVPNGEENLPAIHDIGIDSSKGITPRTLTGLKETQVYLLNVVIDDVEYKLQIPGQEALDFDDLIYKINQEFISLTEPKYSGPFPPKANIYFVKQDLKEVYDFNGTSYTLVDSIFQNNDPTNPILGTYWYNPDDEKFYIYESSGWVEIDYQKSAFDFSDPKCYQFWFDGTHVYKWEKVVWNQLTTYVSETNPLLAPTLDCSTFWYDTNTMLVSQWNIQTKQWNAVDVIYMDSDPNAISSGAYWFNQANGKVYYFAGSTWNELNAVSYESPEANGDFPGTPSANMYWFVAETQKLYRRNTANTLWVELDIIVYSTDPRDRNSCELWWNSDTDELFVWDIVNTQWVEVSAFYQTVTDPSLPPEIPLGSAWMNSVTNVLTIINNPDCSVAQYVHMDTDPTQLTIGDIWFDTTENDWSEWNGSGWSEIDVIVKDSDPYDIEEDEMWFNTAATVLNRWDGTAWDEVPHSLTSLLPSVNELWYNTSDEKLYKWNGVAWVETIGIAAAKLITRTPTTCATCKTRAHNYYNYNDGWMLPYPKDIIRFYTDKIGCEITIEVCSSSPDYSTDIPAGNTIGNRFVFANLTQQVVYFEPMSGYAALQSGPMYQQLGVGTDGNPGERRELSDTIRIVLGDPSTKVELTKEQLDKCIDNALGMIRKNSNVGYKRGMFFMNVNPNQQVYYLKNKCVGFNTIVDINAIYRFRGGFLGLGGNSDLFGYAALQQLYTLGTFDILSFHLVASYIEDLQTMFADNIMFQWIERNRELKMYQVFYTSERVLLDAIVERTEQDLLADRETQLWIQKWAIAEAKMMLSQIRGKFQTLPGPNGTTSLNAQDLISQAQDEMNALKEELNDFVMQDTVDMGMRSHFILG